MNSRGLHGRILPRHGKCGNRYQIGPIIVLLLVFLIPFSALATTIIALRTTDFVIIATDSKATYIGKAGPPTVCKIYSQEELYFAVAGLDHDAKRHFYVQDVVARSLLPGANFDEQVSRIETAVSQSLTTELNRMRLENPGAYMFAIHNSKDVVSIVLAQYQNGIPHLAARAFAWLDNSSPGISVQRMNCPGDCPSGRELLSLGEKTAAERFMRENAGENFDLPALAMKLVHLEIDDSPGNVGPPINELRLDRNGASWVSNGAGCPVVVR